MAEIAVGAWVVAAQLNPLGDDLLEWIVLALGGAMFAGNLGAVIRPRTEQREGELTAAPVARSVAMGAVGFVAAIWALASLVS